MLDTLNHFISFCGNNVLTIYIKGIKRMSVSCQRYWCLKSVLGNNKIPDGNFHLKTKKFTGRIVCRVKFCSWRGEFQQLFYYSSSKLTFVCVLPFPLLAERIQRTFRELQNWACSDWPATGKALERAARLLIGLKSWFTSLYPRHVSCARKTNCSLLFNLELNTFEKKTNNGNETIKTFCSKKILLFVKFYVIRSPNNNQKITSFIFC